MPARRPAIAADFSRIYESLAATQIQNSDTDGGICEHLTGYRVFVINFRAGVEYLVAKAKQITTLFPDWAFPPALPFKALSPAA
jgi:hypothetical protein